MNKLLVFPAGWTPVGPYLALPILKSYLMEKESIEVEITDLNVEYYDWLLTLDCVAKSISEIKKSKNVNRKDLLTFQLIEKSALEIDRAKAIMRGEEFYDLKKREYAENVIKNSLFLISKASNSYTIDLNKVEFNYSYKQTSDVLLAIHDAGNAFIDFYLSGIISRINVERIEFIGISISGSYQ